MDHDAAENLLGELHRAQNAMYSGGPDDAVRALLTPDVTWTVAGKNAIAGSYRGVDTVLAYFRRRRALAGDTLRLYPGPLLTGGGEHVAALTDGSATVGGVERRWSTVGLYRVRDRRIAACWLLPLDPAAFDAAWSSSAPLTVRRSTPQDARRIAEIVATVAVEGSLGAEPPVDVAARSERIAGSIEDGTSSSFVLEREGEIIGGASAADSAAAGVLSFGIVILPEGRGRGGGRALTEAVIEDARKRSAHKLELEVWPDNGRAIALYAAHGFAIEGFRRDHYRRRDGSLRSAVVMGLALGD